MSFHRIKRKKDRDYYDMMREFERDQLIYFTIFPVAICFLIMGFIIWMRITG